MPTDLNELLPPNDANAEKCVLGAILRDNAAFLDAANEIGASDFYGDAHQRIWRAFAALSDAGKPIDPVLVWGVLVDRKDAAEIGGHGYLVELWNSAPTTTTAVYHAKIVREKSKLRAVIRAGVAMQQTALEPGADAAMIVARAGEIVFNLATDRKSEMKTWQEALSESLEVIDRRSGKSLDGESESGLLTGWAKLDQLTGGLHKKELVILAARPSVGKTLAALNIIDAIASEGGRVLFASLEQNCTELLHRVLAKRSGLNSHKFRTGAFSEFDGEALMRASDAIRGHRVWINDSAGQPLSQVIADARRVQAKHGLDMIVVDYLGLMDGERDRRSATRTEEIGRLTRGLKRVAKEMSVVVVCLAQLNRGSENRPDKTPRLADLRDSGEIEQDADTVFMLHKPEDKDLMREVDQLDWLIEKQRNGPCGKIAMRHHKKTFSIYEAAEGGI